MRYRDLTARNWLVLTGAHDLLALEPHRVAHTVAKVFLHPDFNLDTFDSDIALLRLNSPVSWSSTVSPVCLPPPDYQFHSSTQCVITGWGVAGRTHFQFNVVHGRTLGQHLYILRFVFFTGHINHGRVFRLSVCPSVRPSVCHTLALRQNDAARITKFLPADSGKTLKSWR